jgi:hypothetical protein
VHASDLESVAERRGNVLYSAVERRLMARIRLFLEEFVSARDRRAETRAAVPRGVALHEMKIGLKDRSREAVADLFLSRSRYSNRFDLNQEMVPTFDLQG